MSDYPSAAAAFVKRLRQAAWGAPTNEHYLTLREAADTLTRERDELRAAQSSYDDEDYVRLHKAHCDTADKLAAAEARCRELETELDNYKIAVGYMSLDLTATSVALERRTEALREYLRDFGDNEDSDSQRMAEKARAALSPPDSKDTQGHAS